MRIYSLTGAWQNATEKFAFAPVPAGVETAPRFNPFAILVPMAVTAGTVSEPLGP